MDSHRPSETYHSDMVMNEVDQGQVGGGRGYSLRPTLNLTEHASPHSHSAKERRALLEDNSNSICMDFELTPPAVVRASRPAMSQVQQEFFRLGGFTADPYPIPPPPPAGRKPLAVTREATPAPNPKPVIESLFSPHSNRFPSKPPSALTPTSSDIDEDASKNIDGDAGEATLARKGRPSTADRKVMDEAWEQINQIFDQTSAAVNRPVSTLISYWHKSNSNRRSSTGIWNKYQNYFASFSEQEQERMGIPDATPSICWPSFQKIKGFRDILDTHDELRYTKEMDVTLLERSRQFRKEQKNLTARAEDAALRFGFESLIVMVGNCIHEDAGLHFVSVTSGAENFLWERLHLNDSDLSGLLKTHVTNLVAIDVTKAVVERRKAAKVEEQSEVSATSSTALSEMSLEPDEEDDKTGECGERSFNMCKDKISVTIKNAIRAAKGSIAETQLPWKKLPKQLAEQRLTFTNWPLGVDFPGELKSRAQATSQGVRALSLPMLRLLAAACDSPSTAPQCVASTAKADDLLKSKEPIFFSVAPPADSSHQLGRRGFVNGKVDWNGIPQLTVSEIPRQPVNKPKPLSRQPKVSPTPQKKGKDKAVPVPFAKSTEIRSVTIEDQTSPISDDGFVDASSSFSSPSPSAPLESTPVIPTSAVTAGPAGVTRARTKAAPVPTQVTKRAALLLEEFQSHGSNAKKPRIKVPPPTQPPLPSSTQVVPQGSLWPASGFTAKHLLERPDPKIGLVRPAAGPDRAPSQPCAESLPTSVAQPHLIKQEVGNSAPVFPHGWHAGGPNPGPPSYFTGPGYPGYPFPGQYPPYAPHHYYPNPYHVDGPYPPRDGFPDAIPPSTVPHSYPQPMQHFNPALPAYPPGFTPSDRYPEEPHHGNQMLGIDKE